MGDYGIRIAKPYYDVNTCADKDLIFSSAWPSLQVVYDDTPASSTIEHGLGFPPLAFSYTPLDTSSPFSGERGALNVDSTTVYTTAGQRTVVYNLDISTSKQYSVNRTSSVLESYSPDYGVRIAKEGKSIDSTDMRDFILHSRCQSPLILDVLTITNATLSGSTYQIFYTWTDTPPWMYGFVCNASGVWRQSPFVSATYPKLVISGSTARQDIASPDINGCIVVLRDPMFSPTELAASY